MPFLIMAVVLLKRGGKIWNKKYRNGCVGGEERDEDILHEHNDM